VVPKFRALLLLLRQDLQDKDIPRRTKTSRIYRSCLGKCGSTSWNKKLTVWFHFNLKSSFNLEATDWIKIFIACRKEELALQADNLVWSQSPIVVLPLLAIGSLRTPQTGSLQLKSALIAFHPPPRQATTARKYGGRLAIRLLDRANITANVCLYQIVWIAMIW